MELDAPSLASKKITRSAIRLPRYAVEQQVRSVQVKSGSSHMKRRKTAQKEICTAGKASYAAFIAQSATSYVGERNLPNP